MTKYVPITFLDRDGHPSERQYHVKIALRPLHELYGNTPVNKFGSKRLKLVREKMIETGLAEKHGGYSRHYVNNHVSIIKNFFRWGVEEELVPVEVHQALLAVQQLRKGRESRVRDPKKVPPVAKEIVDATLPFLAPQAAAGMTRMEAEGAFSLSLIEHDMLLPEPVPEPGIRLIKRRNVDSFTQVVDDLRDELRDAERDLDNHYDELRSTARNRFVRQAAA